MNLAGRKSQAKRRNQQKFSSTVRPWHSVRAIIMTIRSSKIRRYSAMTLIIGLLVVPKADAHGGHGSGHSGGHGAGHAPRAPHFSGAQRSFKAPRASHSTASAHTNTSSIRTNTSTAQGRANKTQGRAMNAQALTNNSRIRSRTAGAAAVSTGISTNGITPTTSTAANGRSPNSYTYGTGNGAHHYRAYGYGSGYRNRRYGQGYGYGRSQGNNRAIIGRLRSVHSSLARIDHNYQGHRVRAMQSVSMAIRQLSHGSMGYSSSDFSSGMNNGRAMGMRQGRGALNGGGMNGGGGRRRQPMSQAQSDARMSQDLRILQGINMQLGSQGNFSAGHGRASGHVQHAIHELNVALSIR
jgi:hypothetical protein